MCEVCDNKCDKCIHHHCEVVIGFKYRRECLANNYAKFEPYGNYCYNCGEPLTEPKPLTLEELRERDGKPVWIEVLEDGENNPPYWAIIDTLNGRRSRGAKLISYIDQDFGAYELYGETWLAYDRPPKQ